MDVVRHLRGVGVEVDLIDDETPLDPSRGVIDGVIDVALDDRRARFAVAERRRAPYGAEVDALVPRKNELAGLGVPLLVAPYVAAGTGQRLVAAGWCWADATGNFDLRAPGLMLRQRLAAKAPPPARPSLPGGSGSWSVIRWLIVHGDMTSLSKLAVEAGVTQPRVSQVVGQLERLSLVTRTAARIWRPDREQLLDRFLAEYPGPGGSTTYLYSLDEPIESCVRLAVGKPRRDEMAVSADVGADLLVPWQRPTRVVIYTGRPIDLERRLGLTLAHGPGDANVIHRVPDDRSVFSVTTEVDVRGVLLPLADPVQVLWELHDLGGEDRIEQAEKLRQWLLRSR